MNAWQFVLHTLRSSEFWGIVGQAVVEAFALPVPVELKAMAGVVILFRVLSKVMKFIVPNPDNPDGGWVKKD